MDNKIKVDILSGVITKIWWMAQRYCDGRSSYAPSLYNEAITEALKAGVEIKPGTSTPLLAHDGMEKPGSFAIPDSQLALEKEVSCINAFVVVTHDGPSRFCGQTMQNMAPCKKLYIFYNIWSAEQFLKKIEDAKSSFRNLKAEVFYGEEQVEFKRSVD